jgi:hypothetical protein
MSPAATGWRSRGPSSATPRRRSRGTLHPFRRQRRAGRRRDRLRRHARRHRPARLAGRARRSYGDGDDAQEYTVADGLGIDEFYDRAGTGLLDGLSALLNALRDDDEQTAWRLGAGIEGVDFFRTYDGECCDGALIHVDLVGGLRLASLHQDHRDFASTEVAGVDAAVSALTTVAVEANALVRSYRTAIRADAALSAPTPGHAILAALAELGGVATTAQLRHRLGHRPSPQELARLQMQVPGRPARIVQPRPNVYHLTPAGLRELARGSNLAAGLLAATPDTAGPAEPDASDWSTYPSLLVAGAQAFLYVDAGGVLNLSLHLDTGEVPGWLSRADATIPLRVTVNGEDVFADDRPILTPAEPT